MKSNFYRSNYKIDAMRVALGYTGIQKRFLDTKLKYKRAWSILEYWRSGDSVLCLTGDDIDTGSFF